MFHDRETRINDVKESHHQNAKNAKIMFDHSLIKLSRDKKKHEFFVVTKTKIVVHSQSVIKIKSKIEKRDRKKKNMIEKFVAENDDNIV